ncbi:putative phd-finger domain-containing protein [Zalerion maritima]|uniref:Phd-finger domain-containing protein n=1 Tax=Zalerion maritima TaxID=339359 RepID=A0AAD5RIL3_9PEZI|nr:putative phd-finger domain-containing protein [Zalerion maritima]
MASTRASRSRYSSPQVSGNTADPGKKTAAGGLEGQRQFMAKWLEPPVQTKASFQDFGLVRTGVVEHMLPLGTVPKAAHIKKLAEKATAPLEDVATSPASLASTGVAEEEKLTADTPKPAVDTEAEAEDDEEDEDEVGSDGDVEENILREKEQKIQDGLLGGPEKTRSSSRSRLRLEPRGGNSSTQEPEKKPSHLLLKRPLQNQPARKIILKTSAANLSLQPLHQNPNRATPPTLILKTPQNSSLPISTPPPQQLSPYLPTSPATPASTTILRSPSPSSVIRPSSPLDNSTLNSPQQSENSYLDSTQAVAMPSKKATKEEHSYHPGQKTGGKKKGNAQQQPQSKHSIPARRLPRRAAAAAANEALAATAARNQVHSTPNGPSEATGGSTPKNAIKIAARTPVKSGGRGQGTKRKKTPVEPAEDEIEENPMTFSEEKVGGFVERALAQAQRFNRYPTAYAIKTLWEERNVHPNHLNLLRLAMCPKGPQTKQDRDDFHEFAKHVIKLKKEGAKGPAFEGIDERAPAKPAPYADLLAFDIRRMAGLDKKASDIADDDTEPDEMPLSKKQRKLQLNKQDSASTSPSIQSKQTHQHTTLAVEAASEDPMKTTAATPGRGRSTRSSRKSQHLRSTNDNNFDTPRPAGPHTKPTAEESETRATTPTPAEKQRATTTPKTAGATPKRKTPRSGMKAGLSHPGQDSDSELSELASEVEEELIEEFGDQRAALETGVKPGGPIKGRQGSLTTKGTKTSTTTAVPSSSPQPPSSPRSRASASVSASVSASTSTINASSSGIRSSSRRATPAPSTKRDIKVVKKATAKGKQKHKKPGVNSVLRVEDPVFDEEEYRARRQAAHDFNKDATHQSSLGVSAVRFSQDPEEKEDVGGRESSTPDQEPNTPESLKRGRDEEEAEDAVMLEPPFKRPARSTATSRAATPSLAAKGRSQQQPQRQTGPRSKTSPMKNRNGGPAAGIAKHNAPHSSPLGPPDPAGKKEEENDDNCGACGGNGKLLLCDSCPTSLHLLCLDPPLDDIDDEELQGKPFYCHRCSADRKHTAQSPTRLFKKPKKPKAGGPFRHLIEKLNRQNPKSVFLPESVRDCFQGVQTGPDGEFEDAPTKPAAKTKAGYVVEDHFDFYAIRDRKGKYRFCHACGQGPVRGGFGLTNRALCTCPICGLHWHTDCCDPPLSNPPHIKTWVCPAHADEVMAGNPQLIGPGHKFRLLKKKESIQPAYTRGARNHGFVEIVNDDDDEGADKEKPTKATDNEMGQMDVAGYDFTVNTDYGRTYILPSSGIKMDFVSKIQNEREEKRKARQTRGEQDAALSLMVMSRTPAAQPSSTATLSGDVVLEKIINNLNSDIVDLVNRAKTCGTESMTPDDRDRLHAFTHHLVSNSPTVPNSHHVEPPATQASTALSTAASPSRLASPPSPAKSTPSKMNGDFDAVDTSEAVESPKTPEAAKLSTIKDKDVTAPVEIAGSISDSGAEEMDMD